MAIAKVDSALPLMYRNNADVYEAKESELNFNKKNRKHSSFLVGLRVEVKTSQRKHCPQSSAFHALSIMYFNDNQ